MAKMSKGQYLLLASALRDAADIYVDPLGDAFQRGKRAGVMVAAEFIADALSKDNPAFDRFHFIDMIRGKKPLSKPAKGRS